MAIQFLHRGCKGTLTVDIARMFTWTSPSLLISDSGIRIGVTELRSNRSKENGVQFICTHCKESVPEKKLAESSEMSCSVCAETFPVSELGYSKQLFPVCKSCQEVITGKEKPSSQKQQKILQYLYMGMNNVTFVPIEDLLKNSISF